MPSQFDKRKAKSIETVTAEIQDKREKIRSKPEETVSDKVETVYTQSAFDIFTPDGGRNYQVAEIAYNHETGEAKVTNTFDITRLVALSYANQKGALNSLKKRSKPKDGK